MPRNNRVIADSSPIIVLGVNRSGTKWLCNEIGRHPDVAIVAHDDHGGILESNLLTDFGRRFDLADPEQYRDFLDFWSRTHFFSLAGGRREDFEGSLRPSDSVEAFRILMDAYAHALHASFWVQKVGPFNAAHVLERLPSAKIIVIRRALVDTVRSRLKLDRNRGRDTTSFRAALSIALQMREIEKVCQGREAMRVRYEDLKDNREATLAGIAEFLGLRDARWSDFEFPRNTSFSNDRERDRVIGVLDLFSIRLARILVLMVPLSLLKGLRKRLTRETASVLPGTFHHLENSLQTDPTGP